MSNQSLWDDEWIKSQMDKFHSQLNVPNKYLLGSLSMNEGTSSSSTHFNWVREPVSKYTTGLPKQVIKDKIEAKEKNELKFFDPEDLDLDVDK